MRPASLLMIKNVALFIKSLKTTLLIWYKVGIVESGYRKLKLHWRKVKELIKRGEYLLLFSLDNFIFSSDKEQSEDEDKDKEKYNFSHCLHSR